MVMGKSRPRADLGGERAARNNLILTVSPEKH